MEVSQQMLTTGFNALVTNAVPIATKILGAAVLWIVGGWAIKIIRASVSRMMGKRMVDPTLVEYADSALGALLRILLVIAVLGVFGVETTSFSALLAGAGLAIGAAWSGLLSNFAAGVFLVILRPFKVGDYVTVGGVNGTVREIGLFGTVLDTPDNVRTTVGNAKVLGDNVQNYSINDYRRVELKAQVGHGVDVNDAIRRLRTAVAALPGVRNDPAPTVELLEFNDLGAVIAVRPYTHTNSYWDVYFATNKAIASTLADAGYPTPVRNYADRSNAPLRAVSGGVAAS